MIPTEWQNLIEILLAPIAWIPVMQEVLLDFFLFSGSDGIAAAKFVFLLFPVFLLIGAVWCTQLSIYTLPFRSHRTEFISALLVAWWDAIRGVWMFWVGLFRTLGVSLGWIFTIARLGFHFLFQIVRQIVIAPITMTGKMTQSYFQPGVPWIAVFMLILWGLLEATIFTYTLYPTVSEVLADLAGVDAPRFTGTVLFFFLLMLILGSFACIQVLFDGLKEKNYKFVVQMILVEIFVMFFEVLFLYRELVDAITPWIAQQTGDQFQLGIGFTLSIATFGWIGIRGMTWFLFGQFGTSLLLSFISCRPLHPSMNKAPEASTGNAEKWWMEPIRDFKQEIGWLHAKSNEFLEFLALPALQTIAATINFAMILVTARPLFSLPLKNLNEVMETRALLEHLHIKPRRAETLQPQKVER